MKYFNPDQPELLQMKHHPNDKFILEVHRCTRDLLLEGFCFGYNGISGRALGDFALSYQVVPCGHLGLNDTVSSPLPSWLNEIIRISQLTNRMHLEPKLPKGQLLHQSFISFFSFFSSVHQFQARKQRWHEIWQLILWFEVQMAFFH